MDFISKVLEIWHTITQVWYALNIFSDATMWLYGKMTSALLTRPVWQTAIMAVITIPPWWMLLTQPKGMDKVLDGFTKFFEKIGQFFTKPYFSGDYPTIPKNYILVPILVAYFWSFALATIIWRWAKVHRFVITAGFICIPLSKGVTSYLSLASLLGMKKVPPDSLYNLGLGWIAAWAVGWGAWLFWSNYLQGEKEKKRARKIIQEKGLVKGWLFLAFEDFFPEDKNKVKCTKCGEIYEKKDGKLDREYCKCGVILPGADIKCPHCKKMTKGDEETCVHCGKTVAAQPQRQPQAQAPAAAPAQPAQQQQPQAQGPTIVCPHCLTDNPAGTKFCGHCLGQIGSGGTPPQIPPPPEDLGPLND